MSPVVSELLRRLVNLGRRNEAMRLRLRQVEHSRDEWKRKAMERQSRVKVLSQRVRDTRASRELWRYRYERDAR